MWHVYGLLLVMFLSLCKVMPANAWDGMFVSINSMPNVRWNSQKMWGVRPQLHWVSEG